MAKFSKRPLEFYGRLIEDRAQSEFVRLCQSQRCPFLDKRCLKPRKSDPSQTIGSCTLGYQGVPLIVCPYRFLQGNQIFLNAVLLLQPKKEYYIVPEVTMPGGSIDYFLVAKSSDEIVDFVGIEIQSLDTTGSGGIWQARQDLLHSRPKESYKFGINWRMSAKTILVQLHHKAAAFEAIGKKLVLMLQTPFFDYISREFQTQQLRNAAPEDSIHFHVYDCVLLSGKLSLALRERRSTDVRGVEQMLKLGREAEISEAEVIERIRAKMRSARRLDV